LPVIVSNVVISSNKNNRHFRRLFLFFREMVFKPRYASKAGACFGQVLRSAASGGESEQKLAQRSENQAESADFSGTARGGEAEDDVSPVTPTK
jgi:hypothetical protein